jgi:hypothetical protein
MQRRGQKLNMAFIDHPHPVDDHVDETISIEIPGF